MLSDDTDTDSSTPRKCKKLKPADFDRIEETKTPNEFIMVHKGEDRSKDRRINLIVEDGDPIWEGIGCLAIEMSVCRMSKYV